MTWAVLTLAILAGAAATWAVLASPRLLPPLLVVSIFTQQIGVGSLTLSRALVPLVVGIVVLRHLLEAPGRRVERLVPLLVASYALLCLLSAFWTTDDHWSLTNPGTAFSLASLVIALSYYAAFVSLVTDEGDVRRLLWTIFATSAVSGSVTLATSLVTGQRASGLVSDPNFFAAFQLVALPIGIQLAAGATGRRRALLVAGCSVTLLSIVASGSRGGLVALLVLAGAAAVHQLVGLARRRPDLIPAGSALVVAALLGLALVAPQLVSDEQITERGGPAARINLWQASLTAVADRPLLGIGFGAFQPASNDLLRRTPGVDFSDFRLRDEGFPVHNAYLGTWAELGPAGTILFAGLFLAGWSGLRRAAADARRSGARFLAGASQALSVSLLGYALTSVFLSTELSRPLWMMLGLVVVLRRLTAPGPLSST